MLSDAANGYYRRNLRMGVPGAANSLGGRLLRRSSLAPNVQSLNARRSINSRSGPMSPLAMIGQALIAQGSPTSGLDPALQTRMQSPLQQPLAGPGLDPALATGMQAQPQLPMPYLAPSAGLGRLVRRPVPRRTPFVF